LWLKETFRDTTPTETTQESTVVRPALHIAGMSDKRNWRGKVGDQTHGANRRARH